MLSQGDVEGKVGPEVETSWGGSTEAQNLELVAFKGRRPLLDFI